MAIERVDIERITVVAFGLIVPAIIGSSLTIFNDGDVHWHIAAGQWMLDHQAVLRADPFSFTAAGKPWTAFEWGSQLLFGAAHRLCSRAENFYKSLRKPARFGFKNLRIPARSSKTFKQSGRIKGTTGNKNRSSLWLIKKCGSKKKNTVKLSKFFGKYQSPAPVRNRSITLSGGKMAAADVK